MAKYYHYGGDCMPVAHKSAISVGLLYIPVGLYKTTRNASISFNQLCKDSKERIRYKKYCPSCDKEIKNEDIIKGYEYEKGKYVTFTSDELEKIKTKKDKTIHVEHFAKMSLTRTIILFRRRGQKKPMNCCVVPCWQKKRWRWQKQS